MRAIVVAFALLPLIGAATLARQQFMREPQVVSDFPASDELIRSYQLMGRRAEAAASALQTAPDRAATFDLLVKAGRTAEALTVLERITATRPAEMKAALPALDFAARDIGTDAAHDYADRLRTSVAAAKRQLPGLDREAAAEIARVLVSVENELNIKQNDWAQRLQAFVAEYTGTREALLAEVDLLADRPHPTMIDALDAFARAHPGTDAAAKAIYTKGFHLGHNGMSFGERPGHDPTERFFRVFEIYKELRSGRYPPSEWVTKAPTLVMTEFSSYKPV